MFTQAFSAHLHFSTEIFEEEKTFVIIDFYNQKNELCAILTTELHWFDYTNWEPIEAPKNIAQHFLTPRNLKRAV